MPGSLPEADYKDRLLRQEPMRILHLRHDTTLLRLRDGG